MKVLLTGGSGFLGSEINKAIEIENEVISIGRGSSNAIRCDISDTIPFLPACDSIIHVAGKAHLLPKNEIERNEFFKVNVIGTQNLLNSLSPQNLKSFIFISSVSVYGLEEGELIDEMFPLMGTSPYAKSKILAEKIISDWCVKKKIPLLIFRLPLLVGLNPPGNLGKMIAAIRKGLYLRIAKGHAKKSMVLTSDVAAFISHFIKIENPKSGIYNLTDGYHPSFFELESEIAKVYNRHFIPAIPKWVAILLGRFGDIVSFFPINSSYITKITKTFTFSDVKARTELNWNPHSVLSQINKIIK
jgi:nucleoside-diphosphate-sugar epimerase